MWKRGGKRGNWVQGLIHPFLLFLDHNNIHARGMEILSSKIENYIHHCIYHDIVHISPHPQAVSQSQAILHTPQTLRTHIQLHPYSPLLSLSPREQECLGRVYYEKVGMKIQIVWVIQRLWEGHGRGIGNPYVIISTAGVGVKVSGCLE